MDINLLPQLKYFSLALSQKTKIIVETIAIFGCLKTEKSYSIEMRI